MLGIQVLWTIIKIVIMIAFTLNVAAILTWADRRMSAMIQDRVGPNRAVIKIFGKEIRLAGLLHPAADGVKFFTKEDFLPPKADKLLFAIAPVLALLVAIPFTDTICPNAIVRTVVKDGQSATWWPAVARYGVCGMDKGV